MAKNLYDIAQGKETKDKAIKLDILLIRAIREYYGSRGRVLLNSPITENSKKAFLKRLFSDAKNINPRKQAKTRWMSTKRSI